MAAARHGENSGSDVVPDLEEKNEGRNRPDQGENNRNEGKHSEFT